MIGRRISFLLRRRWFVSMGIRSETLWYQQSLDDYGHANTNVDANAPDVGGSGEADRLD